MVRGLRLLSCISLITLIMIMHSYMMGNLLLGPSLTCVCSSSRLCRLIILRSMGCLRVPNTLSWIWWLVTCPGCTLFKHHSIMGHRLAHRTVMGLKLIHHFMNKHTTIRINHTERFDNGCSCINMDQNAGIRASRFLLCELVCSNQNSYLTSYHDQ